MTSTAAENLTTARDNYARILSEISASPKPSYTVEGMTYSWTDYQKFLIESITKLNDAIAAVSDDGGIVEEITEIL